MENIQIKNVIQEDLVHLPNIQPEDWPDIIPSIEFYIYSEFCFPIKVVQNSEIVGIGSLIVFENTCWLAHIIVHPDYRKKGIGSLIVNHLLENVKVKKLGTALLIATALGEPVYKKAGFEKATDYLFLKRENKIPQFRLDERVISYLPNFKNDILKMDLEITGENRKRIITSHLKDAFLFIENLQLQGYYLPTFGEGLIIAVTEQAGTELLKLRCQTSEKIVIPQENKTAYKFLIELGYKETSRCSRMFLGKPIKWQPQNYFSRVGGNFG